MFVLILAAVEAPDDKKQLARSKLMYFKMIWDTQPSQLQTCLERLSVVWTRLE